MSKSMNKIARKVNISRLGYGAFPRVPEYFYLDLFRGQACSKEVFVLFLLLGRGVKLPKNDVGRSVNWFCRRFSPQATNSEKSLYRSG